MPTVNDKLPVFDEARLKINGEDWPCTVDLCNERMLFQIFLLVCTENVVFTFVLITTNLFSLRRPMECFGELRS